MMSLAIMSDPIAQTLLRVLILFLLMALVLFLMNHRFKSEQEKKADVMQKKYKEMTKELLAEVPDNELLDAVAANLMAKLDKQTPDPYHTFALLTPGRNQLYAVWVLLNEMKNGGTFQYLLASSSAPFCEPAADGMNRIGATKCEAAIREALDAGDEWEKLGECNEHFFSALEEENPKGLCIQYIRENINEFIDNTEEPAEAEQELSEE